MKWWVVSLLFLFLIGCGLVQRQQLMRDNFPSYPPEMQSAIRAGRVIEGMNKEQVYLSIGLCECRTSSYYKGRQVDVWAWETHPLTGRPWAGSSDCWRANKRVYFENGIVVGWDNMN